MWDLSCVDWRERMRAGQSLIPDHLPLIEAEAKAGLAFFDELCLPDVPGKPKMRDAAGDWFRDLTYTTFGSWDPSLQTRYIRDIFLMAPKGQSKTSYSAGLMLTAMLMNHRPRAEALFIGPTQAISDRAYEQAVGMIEESPDMKKRFRPRDHLKTIEDLFNKSEMKVKTFDLKILTGSILIFALLDEIHLLGRNTHTGKLLRQIRGGLDKTSEGVLLITTTQSDEPPAGAFKEELHLARKIRDGAFRGQEIRPMLPVLHEFPEDIAKDPAKWQDPTNWPMVMPNLGRSTHLNDLVPDWNTEKTKGEHAIRVWASQHLNIEIGLGLKTDAWPGAVFWERSVDDTLTLEALLERSEVVVVGLDGGGLDDLFGVCVLGREKGTKRWLAWSTAYAHEVVLERRQSIATKLLDFHKEGEIWIIDEEMIDVAEEVALVDDLESLMLPKDVAGILKIVDQVNRAGLLASVAVDVEGPLGELVDALAMIGVTEESGQIDGVGQGYKLMSAIKTMERKAGNGTLKHSASAAMSWNIENLKIEPTATAIRATKQNAGDNKIDMAIAMFNAGSIMLTNPEPKGSGSYLEEEELILV